MGQAEVLEFLQLKRKWFSVVQIAAALKTNAESIRRSLKQMHKYNEVKLEIKRFPSQRHRVMYWKVL